MNNKVWVISVNMGYGHQRTAYPLRNFAPHQGWWGVINANDYPGIPEKDRAIWESMRRSYEALSRFSRIPLIGKAFFSIYDQLQKILAFYPKRDLSKPNFALKQIYSLLKKGWGRDLIEKLKIKNQKLKITILNLDILEKKFNLGEKVTPQILLEKRLIRKIKGKMPEVKILRKGELTKKLIIEGCQVSKTAKEQIEKIGGTIK